MFKSRILCRSVFFSVLGVLVVFTHTVPVSACGGVTATIADNPEAFGVETRSGLGGVALYVDRAGDVFVVTKNIKITSALAEAIAKRYLQKKYKFYEQLAFEAFSCDHGDLWQAERAYRNNLDCYTDRHSVG